MVIGKTEQNSILDGGELYLRGNNTDSYVKIAQLENSVRHMIYCGGSTPFVIIYDVAKKIGNHTYSVNFYTNADNEVAIPDGGSYARIIGKKNGKPCFVLPFSQIGVKIKKTPTFNGISTSTEATDIHRQATVFVAADKEEPPKVDFSLDDGKMTVSITLDENGKSITKRYTFADGELISPKAISTEEKRPIPDDVLASIAQEANVIK